MLQSQKQLNKSKPDIVVKGKEHENQQNDELGAIQEYGGKLIFSSGEVVFSSMDLIRKGLSSNEQSNITLPRKFYYDIILAKKTL